MGFFDKIDNSVNVIAFKKIFNRKDHKIFHTDIPQTGTFH